METTIASIWHILKQSRDERKLLPLAVRKRALQQLQRGLDEHQEDIMAALVHDLGRPRFESYISEIALIKTEIKTALNSLARWSAKKKVHTSLPFQPGSSWIIPTPKGLVLIIAPWNYPFQLSLIPLVSAIAAGNCAIIKPSDLAPHSSAVIANIVKKFLDPDCFSVLEGDHLVCDSLLDEPFDHIFFTGSTHIGRHVMEKAALNLTPVTLELGGKSPAIMDESSLNEVSIKRLLWGKFINAGQTCIAPDYVLIKKSLINDFVQQAKKQLFTMFGSKPHQSSSFARIINERHLLRLMKYLKQGVIVHGGSSDQKGLFLEPTLMTDVALDEAVMQEEIFGPILPIVGVNSIHEAIGFINDRPRPLSLYIFSSSNKNIDKVLHETNSGSVGINDCVSQAGLESLPFGGVGQSGFGNYHGHHGFLTFSHMRAVYQRSLHLDNSVRYPPYSHHKLNMAKLIL